MAVASNLTMICRALPDQKCQEARQTMLLAQSNIALFRWPVADKRMHVFASQVETLNVLAESSPGFIWRYSEVYDGSQRPRPFNDPLLFFNMSVWRDVESLKQYVYETEHFHMLQRKSEWTRPASDGSHVMWWIHDGEKMPSVDDAILRFTKLDRQSETKDAFTFNNIVQS